jgi:hypothetical protein
MHAPVVSQGACLRTMLRAGTTRQLIHSESQIPGSPRAEAERRNRRTEECHHRCSNRRRQVKRCRVVGHQHRGSADQRRGSAKSKRSCRADGPRGSGSHDGVGQVAVRPGANDHA